MIARLGATRTIKRIVLAGLIALTGTLAFTEVQALCCPAVLTCSPSSVGAGGSVTFYQYCADCSSGQTFFGLGGGCATGKCNVFACNCDGHCRTGNPHCSTQIGAQNVCVQGGAIAAAPSALAVDANETPLARFRRYDLDGDNAISSEELLKAMGVYNQTIDPDDLRYQMIQLVLAQFHALDKNQNGKIDPSEFDRELAEPQ